MIYEVRATMYFTDLEDADDFFDNCQDALEKATVVNPGQPNQECSQADLILCHHDDHPPESCHLGEHHDNCPPPGP